MAVTRPAAEDRLRRILAVVPWVAAADGPAVSDVCARFGYATEDELRRDFDLLFVCGIHPYTPDTLIEVDFADDRVWVRYADWFSRPLRLTPPEALTLVAASAALLGAGTGAHDVNGPLARGLAKLAVALGVDAEDVVDVELGAARAEVLQAVRDAADRQQQIEIEYYGYGRDEHSTRVIEPSAVYSAGGQWYVAGYCHRAGGRRLFRADRIEAVRSLDTPFVETPDDERPEPYQPDPEDPHIVLDLTGDTAWVPAYHPVLSAEPLAGGAQRVELQVSGEAWLARLLLRLGPDAEVVSGDPSAALDAAARILARYGSAAGDTAAGTGTG